MQISIVYRKICCNLHYAFMVRRLSIGENNHLTCYSLAINPQYGPSLSMKSFLMNQRCSYVHVFVIYFLQASANWFSFGWLWSFVNNRYWFIWNMQEDKTKRRWEGNVMYTCTCTFNIATDKRGIHIIFLWFLHENICCGYSLEVPRRGASNEYHNICFCGEIRKISAFFGWKKVPYLLLCLILKVTVTTAATEGILFYFHIFPRK